MRLRNFRDRIVQSAGSILRRLNICRISGASRPEHRADFNRRLTAVVLALLPNGSRSLLPRRFRKRRGFFIPTALKGTTVIVSGSQIKTGRLLLEWARMTLALKAQVSNAQIVCFETGKKLSLPLGRSLAGRPRRGREIRDRALQAPGVDQLNVSRGLQTRSALTTDYRLLKRTANNLGNFHICQLSHLSA